MIRSLDGRELVTLRDAVDYITGQPKKESALPEWPDKGFDPCHLALPGV
jgi:hypothetical protein